LASQKTTGSPNPGFRPRARGRRRRSASDRRDCPPGNPAGTKPGNITCCFLGA
jgi:hypothetical protein